MEAARYSDASVPTRVTLRHIPEDATLHKHSCEQLKSYIETNYFGSPFEYQSTAV
jgi:hypothetical protein